MTEEKLLNHFGKKAYEIGYAVFMIANHIKAESLRSRLEDRAAALLAETASGRYESGNEVLGVLAYLLKFGADVNLIHPENSALVVNEINNLSEALTGFLNSSRSALVDISDVFTKSPAHFAEKEKREPSQKEPVGASASGTVRGNGGHGQNLVKSAMRQSAIIERIRQNGNCRLRDIMEFLPDTSERTIRYDLEGLIEKGLIERVGSGGPSVYYRVRPGLPAAELPLE